MRKTLVTATVLGSLALAGCSQYDPTNTEEYVQFKACQDKGGSYASEDTSAGRKWTCTVDGNEAHIQDNN